MRTLLGKIGALAILAAVTAGAMAAASRSGAPTSDQSGLVAHEWGTFSCFSGSNGVLQRFHPANTDLPKFVYRGLDCRKGEYHGLVSLETPVLYFYSDQPATVSVEARFSTGEFTFRCIGRPTTSFSVGRSPRRALCNYRLSGGWGRIGATTTRLEQAPDASDRPKAGRPVADSRSRTRPSSGTTSTRRAARPPPPSSASRFRPTGASSSASSARRGAGNRRWPASSPDSRRRPAARCSSTARRSTALARTAAWWSRATRCFPG